MRFLIWELMFEFFNYNVWLSNYYFKNREFIIMYYFDDVIEKKKFEIGS